MLHKPKKIRIGTRKSKLAVCQTELVAKAISKYYDMMAHACSPRYLGG